MEQSPPTENASSPTSSAAGALGQVDMQLLKARLLGLFQNPVPTLETLKSEPYSISDLYQKYILPLVVLPALCAFIGISLLGPGTIMGGIVGVIVKVIFGAVGIYLVMLLVQQISPYFGGTKENPLILKWLISSMFINAAAGCLQILFFVPVIGFLVSLVGLLAALYSIYISWLGIPIFIGITDSKRLPFLLSVIGMAILIAVVISAIGLTKIFVMG